MISYRDLEFLSALARRKHFARAAEDCGVSQPAFSMRIRKIEERLGVAVVKRGNRFQGFTAEGNALVRHARKIIGDFKVMEQELRSSHGQINGTLSIGAIPTATIHAARLVKKLQEHHPGIKVTLQTVSSLAIQQGLLDGQYEVGLTYEEGVANDLFQIDALYQETYLLLAPKKFVPKTKEEITWAEAAQMPLCLLETGMQNRSIIDQVFVELGFEPQVMAETSGFLAAMILASEGGAATIVPRHLLEAFGPLDGTVALNLSEPKLEKTVSLVALTRDMGLPTAEALRQICNRAS